MNDRNISRVSRTEMNAQPEDMARTQAIKMEEKKSGELKRLRPGKRKFPAGVFFGWDM